MLKSNWQTSESRTSGAAKTLVKEGREDVKDWNFKAFEGGNEKREMVGLEEMVGELQNGNKVAEDSDKEAAIDS